MREFFEQLTSAPLTVQLRVLRFSDVEKNFNEIAFAVVQQATGDVIPQPEAAKAEVGPNRP